MIQMRVANTLFFLAMLASSSAMAGDGVGLDDGRRSVTITFALTAGELPVTCGARIDKLGLDSTPALLRDARIYIQDPALIDIAGQRVPLALAENDWQNRRVVLLDFARRSETCGTPAFDGNNTITGTIPAGTYTGLAFTVGVPEQMNHTSTELEAPPLDLAAMGWSWQAGRKFVNIEVDPDGGILRDDGTPATTWSAHLGSTGCKGNPMGGEAVNCLYPNRIPVVLAAFDVERDHVAVDLAALFQGSRLSQDRGGAAGCMGSVVDPECGPLFSALGLSIADGKPNSDGESQVFRAHQIR